MHPSTKKEMPIPPVFPSVVHMLVDAAAKAPEHEALVCEDVRLNYGEYLRCALGFAAELRREGVNGGRVAIALGNSVDICIALLGAQMVGAQVALLNPLQTEYELLPLLTDIDASAIIYTADKKAVIESLADRLGVRCRHCLEPNAQTLTRWRQTPATIESSLLPDRESLALLLYTGGTTGVPKGVDLTHSALAHGVAQLNSLVPARHDKERLLCATPLYHIYSIFVGMNNMLYRRGTLVILPRYSTDGVLDALEAESITILAGGPTMLVGLLANESLPRRRFGHLRFSFSGASALPAETLHRFERATGAPVLEGYGQTETGGGVIFNPLEGVHKPGSVGIPLAGVDVEIVDTVTGSKVLPVGEAGEIRLRGPQLMRGYRGLPEETAAVWRDGWLHTTDIGYFDSDGYLFISDRMKDMVIVSGFNVYPRTIEEVLYRHPDIIEASVIGITDPYQGEALKAFVVVRPDKQLSADEITLHCRSQLSPYKVPRQIEFIDALPKTSVGKIDKMRLRKWNAD